MGCGQLSLRFLNPVKISTRASGPPLPALRERGRVRVFLRTTGECIHSSLVRFFYAARRRLVDYRPKRSQLFHRIDELVEVHRFNHVGVDTQLVTFTRSRSSCDEVRTTTGIILKFSSARTCSRTSKPLTFGNRKSSDITAGLPVGPLLVTATAIQVVERFFAIARDDDFIGEVVLRRDRPS